MWLRGVFTLCHAALWLAWASVAHSQQDVALPDAKDAPKGLVKLLWPIHLSSYPLSTRGKKSLESPQMGAEMTRIALEKFNEYRKKILPKELKKDKELAEDWKKGDHSRLNLAFRRWQLRTFVEREAVPIEKLTARGDKAPKLQGINYSWPELYDNSVFKRFKNRAVESAKLYLRRSGYDTKGMQLLPFFWAEIFERGEMMRPFSRADGAYVMGRYFAKMQQHAQKFNFEDPRGINPPFGKTQTNNVYEGELLVFPGWVSQFVTPNMHNATTVTYSFAVYPTGPNIDLQDDKTGKIIVERPYSVKPPPGRGGR